MHEYYQKAKTYTNNVVYTATQNKKELGLATLSEEDVSEAAPLLENILQDALLQCNESCCADVSVDLQKLAENIIKTLLTSFSIPNVEKQGYLHTIERLKQEINQLKYDNYAPQQNSKTFSRYDKNHSTLTPKKVK